MNGYVTSIPIGSIQVKNSTIVDPGGNMREQMELPAGVDHLPQP